MSCESCIHRNRCDFRKRLLALVKDHNGKFKQKQLFLQELSSLVSYYCNDFSSYYTYVEEKTDEKSIGLCISTTR